MARSNPTAPTMVPEAVLEGALADKLAFMDAMLIKHPKMVAALQRLIALTVPRGGTDIALLIGPTGAGKSATLELAKRAIEDQYKAEMVADPGFIPAVLMEAPHSGEIKYSWSYFYTVLGEAINEPLMNRKREPADDSERFLLKPLGRTSSVGAMRLAIENALKNRRTKLVMVDEGLHLLSGCAGDTLVTRMNGIKSIANAKGRNLALSGSYDLFNVLTMQDQLARRAGVVHLGRYRIGKSDDERAYRKIIAAMQLRLPIRNVPDLTGCWELLMEMNFGCAGALRDTFARTVTLASEGTGCWKDEYLEDSLLTNTQVKSIMTTILASEAMVEDASFGGKRRGILWKSREEARDARA